MRIGVLTSGGDCPGLNAVIRSVVHRAVVDHGDEVIGFRDGWRGLLECDYLKLDLVNEIQHQLATGTVTYVQRAEDPRDYKVSFEKVKATLGYAVTKTVPDGIAEVAHALDEGRFPDSFAPRYRNTP